MPNSLSARSVATVVAKRVGAASVANLATVTSNGSDAGRAKNRRVELVVQ